MQKKLSPLLAFLTMLSLSCQKITEDSFDVKACFTVESPAGQCLQDCLVRFVNCSENASDYLWDYGDGSSFSHEREPQHTYASPGVYTARLIVFRRDKADSTEQEVTIGAQYLTDFSVESASPDFYTASAVEFKNLSVNANEFEWDFGDQSGKNTEKNPTHIYTQAGNYTVRLIARKGGQQVGSKEMTLSVKKFPTYTYSVYVPNIVSYGGFEALEASDGGLIIVSGNVVFKTKPNGHLQWAEYFTDQGQNMGFSKLLRMEDGSILAKGSDGSMAHFSEDKTVYFKKIVPSLAGPALVAESSTPGRIITLISTPSGYSIIETDVDGQNQKLKYELESSTFQNVYALEKGPGNFFAIGGGTVFGGSIALFDSLFQPVIVRTNFSLNGIYELYVTADQSMVFKDGLISICKIDRENRLLWCRETGGNADMQPSQTGQLVYAVYSNYFISLAKVDAESNNMIWFRFDIVPITTGYFNLLSLRDGGYAIITQPSSIFTICKTNPFGEL